MAKKLKEDDAKTPALKIKEVAKTSKPKSSTKKEATKNVTQVKEPSLKIKAVRKVAKDGTLKFEVRSLPFKLKTFQPYAYLFKFFV